MKIEPFKMRVTPEQSRRVQEIIFENGGEWRGGQTTVINTNLSYLAFDLHGDGDGISGWTAPSTGFPPFMDAAVAEITYDEFINKYGKQIKNLKLEVGKTYRSRKGEEVEIVDFCGEVPYPYKGNRGRWYRADGRWANAESPHDLIEEATKTRHTFTIPDGVKELTVEQVGNRIVVEIVPGKEPKPGDVLVNEHKGVYIFKSDAGYGNHNYYAWVGKSGRLSIEWVCKSGRPATPEEAQPLWDALKKAGKRWNSETLQVEEIPEIDRIREWVKRHLISGTYNQEGITGVIEAYLKYRGGK